LGGCGTRGGEKVGKKETLGTYAWGGGLLVDYRNKVGRNDKSEGQVVWGEANGER